jgi:hypothetical protein
MHPAEPSVFLLVILSLEIDIEKFKIYKSSSIDQIPAEQIQARGNTLCSETHKLTNSVWNKEDLPQQWN